MISLMIVALTWQFAAVETAPPTPPPPAPTEQCRIILPCNYLTVAPELSEARLGQLMQMRCRVSFECGPGTPAMTWPFQ